LCAHKFTLNVMMCVCIVDILASDKQLAEEIEFDLRRFEEEQKKAATKGQTPAVITPHTKVVSHCAYIKK